TDDIQVLGGFTNPFYEKAIKENVATWTFTPGTVDGGAQDFLNQRHTFKMQVSDQLGVSPGVQKELEPLRTLLSEKKFDDARKAIERLLQRETHSVLDFGLLNQMMATAQLGLNDPFSALEYSKLATMS